MVQKYQSQTLHTYELVNNKIYLQQWLTVKNSQTSASTLGKLATSNWLFIRKAIAKHPNADAQVLAILTSESLSDDSIDICRLVPQHPNATPEILVQLALHKATQVQIAVARNPKTPLKILRRLASKRQTSMELRIAATKTIAHNYPEIMGNVLAQLVESPEPSVAKIYLLLHPIAPSEFLAQHFRSSFWWERYAVAQNPNTPFNIRQYLIQDGNRIVRAAAKAYLY